MSKSTRFALNQLTPPLEYKMKQLLITIAAVVLVGCGGSESFTEKINNPWLWIAILPILYSVLYAVLSSVLSSVLGGAIILVGYFLVKFLFPKNKDEKNEELKAVRK